MMTPQTTSDETILARWCSDPSAGKACFQTLYERHRERTYRFYLNLTRNKELAEDLNQTLYTELYTSYQSYAGKGRFLSWLFQIARNIFYDAVVRPFWNQTVKVDPGVYAQPLEQKDDSARRPDRVLGKIEKLECFLECFERLSSMEKTVLAAHYFHGEPVDKLSERLGLDNPSGARKFKTRALRHLKKAMLERMGEAEAKEEKS